MSDQSIRRVLRYCLITLRWIANAAVGFALIFFAGTFVILHLLPRTYVGASLVQLEQPAAVKGRGAPVFSDALLAEQVTRAQSEPALDQVIDRLDLQHAWARGQAHAMDGEISRDEARARLRNQVHVRSIPGTNILDLVASSASSQEAADLANALADAYKARAEPTARSKPADPFEVLILTRAAPPQIPTRPNIPFDTTVVLILAIFLGASLASFVEILFLFRRAGDRSGNGT